MTITLRSGLAQQIAEISGENVYLCYQCKKCTAGCPVASYFDLKPHVVMRACQFGQRDLVLNSRTIWICAACETCSTRCPQGIDIAKIMDVLEIMAQEQGIRAKARPVPMFYKAANRTIDLFGRMWELGLMAELYARMFLARELDVGQVLKYDMPMAIKMLRSGKLKLLPHWVRRPKDGRRPVPEADELDAYPTVRPKAPPVSRPDVISYYPGCSLHVTGIEYHMSTLAVAEKLGLRLEEPEGWVCCGTSPAHNTNHYRAVKLPMQTLAVAQRMGHSYITMPCAACFSRFRIAMHEMQHDPGLRERIAEDIGFEYAGGIQVDSLLATITERIGYDAVRARVTQPLQGLKVVNYYGCLLTRPPEATGVQNYEYPMNMDRLMETLGAESLGWNYKCDCCGGSLSLSQLDIALDLSRKILADARAVGADVIVTACPLCHINLDSRQDLINDRFGEEHTIPVVYFTQMMGLAFGLGAKTLGMDKHLSDAVGLFRERGLLPA